MKKRYLEDSEQSLSIDFGTLVLGIILALNFLFLIPFFADTVGGKLENFLFIPLYGIFISYLIYQARNQSLKIDWKNLAVVALFILIVFSSHTKQPKPLFFGFLVLLLSLVSFNLDLTFRYKYLLRLLIIAYCLINIALVPFSQFYFFGNRFMGFLLSPTVQATLSLMLLITCLIIEKNKYTKIFVVLSLSAFVLLSGTRLNIAFLLGLVFVFPLRKRILKNRKFFFVSYLLAVITIYPVYDLFTQSSYASNLNRYEGEKDKSYVLRSALSIDIFLAIAKSSPSKILLGNGSDASRLRIEKKWGRDLHVHNDFLRITYDFGAIGLILLILIIYNYASKSFHHMILSWIYFLSFYHNMVYSIFIISFLILLPSNPKFLVKKV